jgi:hypothetical protein
VTIYTSLTQYLEVRRKKKWLSDSDICVGDVSIRKLEELFSLTPKAVYEHIRSSVSFLAPAPLKTQCDLDILCDILDILIRYTVEHADLIGQ